MPTTKIRFTDIQVFPSRFILDKADDAAMRQPDEFGLATPELCYAELLKLGEAKWSDSDRKFVAVYLRVRQ